MGDKVRMAFIGLGRWSGKLADGAIRSKRIEIAACHSRSQDKMTAFVSKYGGGAKQAYKDVLVDEGIDAVVLVTPNSLHAPQAIEAISYGKHVFVEKPMATSVADCKQMIRAAQKAGVVLFVGHKERRLARMRKAKALIDQGAVGQVVLAEANQSGDVGMKITPEDWRWFRKEGVAGPLGPFTVHHADNFHYLVGPVRRVTALMSKVCGKAEADDVISASLEFENRALGYLGGTWLTPRRKFVQIHGTEGIVLVDEEGGAVYYQKRGTKKMISQGEFGNDETQRQEGCFEEMDEFACSIQEGRRPETGGEEGLAAWAVIEAIIRSSESSLPVSVKDLIEG
jgi:UDP-N-acetylglucosamine 3-dehydrogenase